MKMDMNGDNGHYKVKKLNKTDEIVKHNIKEFEQYNNYFVQGNTIIIGAKDGKPHRVGVQLQIFTDDNGKVIMIREAS